MAIETVEKDIGGYRVVMTACPLPWCDHRFDPGEYRANHFLNDHTPEDFGLGK